MPKIAPPDAPCGRWCNPCNQFVPITNFAVGVRRFTCRRCRALARKKPDSPTSYLNTIYHFAYVDSKNVYKSSGKVDLKIGEIKSLCAASGIEPTCDLRVVPQDPHQPISKDNLVLVGKIERALLNKVWKEYQDIAVYKSFMLRNSTNFSFLTRDVSHH